MTCCKISRRYLFIGDSKLSFQNFFPRLFGISEELFCKIRYKINILWPTALKRKLSRCFFHSLSKFQGVFNALILMYINHSKCVLSEPSGLIRFQYFLFLLVSFLFLHFFTFFSFSFLTLYWLNHFFPFPFIYVFTFLSFFSFY